MTTESFLASLAILIVCVLKNLSLQLPFRPKQSSCKKCFFSVCANNINLPNMVTRDYNLFWGQNDTQTPTLHLLASAKLGLIFYSSSFPSLKRYSNLNSKHSVKKHLQPKQKINLSIKTSNSPQILPPLSSRPLSALTSHHTLSLICWYAGSPSHFSPHIWHPSDGRRSDKKEINNTLVIKTIKKLHWDSATLALSGGLDLCAQVLLSRLAQPKEGIIMEGEKYSPLYAGDCFFSGAIRKHKLRTFTLFYCKYQRSLKEEGEH